MRKGKDASSEKKEREERNNLERKTFRERKWQKNMERRQKGLSSFFFGFKIYTVWLGHYILIEVSYMLHLF